MPSRIKSILSQGQTRRETPSYRKPFGFRADVHKIVERLMQEAIDKFYDRVIKIAKQIVVDALKPCVVSHNKAFIKGALSRALNGSQVSILAGSPGNKEPFEDKQTTKSSESFTTSSDAKDNAIKVKVLLPPDSHLQNLTSYKTHRLVNKSQTYNGKWLLVRVSMPSIWRRQ